MLWFYQCSDFCTINLCKEKLGFTFNFVRIRFHVQPFVINQAINKYESIDCQVFVNFYVTCIKNNTSFHLGIFNYICWDEFTSGPFPITGQPEINVLKLVD